MRTLSVIAPQDLYRFARDEGLLAHPGAPEPTRTTHPIAATTVVAHDDTSNLLPAMALDTVSSFKLIIPNATVLGSNLGIVFGNYLMHGGFYHQHFWVSDGHAGSNHNGQFKLSELPTVNIPLERVQLMGHSSHWGHFFTDTLDRLLAAADAGELGMPLLTDSKPSCPNAMQMLDHAGVIDTELSIWSLHRPALYHARELHMHTLTSLKPAAPVESLARVREQLRRQLPPHDRRTRPLFVGRQQVKTRRIEGQDSLCQWLKESGHADVVYPEALNVLSSITLFQRYRAVLLPIGSAKFNLTFCEPGTQVIAITPHGYAEGNGSVCQLLRHMCARLDLPLTFYACRSMPSAGPRAHMKLHDDLLLTPEDIKRMVALLAH